MNDTKSGTLALYMTDISMVTPDEVSDVVIRKTPNLRQRHRHLSTVIRNSTIL